ncbi:MAG: hypothetical protein AAGD96_11005 [Chloroflexota bacterium]
MATTELRIDSRKFNTMGWEGAFKVSTRLLKDKEIDIDDREAELLFTLEMKDDTKNPIGYKLEDVEVILDLGKGKTQGYQSINIEGKTSGEVTLITKEDQKELFPGAAINKRLTVKTGAFSSDKWNSPSAEPGLKEYDIKIRYNMVSIKDGPEDRVRSRVVSPAFFYVGSD